MTLSDEDRRRIDEEEYRNLSRERLERIEAEIRTTGDQQIAPPAQAPPETQANTVAIPTPVAGFLAGSAGAAIVGTAIVTGGMSLIGAGIALGVYGIYKLGSRSR
jgi:hypothetical protein